MNLGDINGLAAPGRVIRPLPTGVGHGSQKPAGQKDEIAISSRDGLVRWDAAEYSWRSLNLSSINAGATRSASLNRWRIARGNVVQGLGEAKVMCDGDSTTAGSGATSNDRTKSWPAQLAKILTARGVAATSGSVWSTPTLGVTDTRLTLGTDWAAASDGGGPALGFKATCGGSGEITFTPVEAWDRMTVYFAQPSWTVGTVTAKVAGSSVGTFEPSTGYTSWSTVTFNAASVAVQAASLTCPATGSNWFVIAGIDTWRSDRTQVHLWNMGRPGATLTTGNTWGADAFDATAYKPLPFMTDADTRPDLTISSYGINDANNGVNHETFRALLSYMVANVYGASSNSVLVCSPPQSATSTYQMSTDRYWAPFRAAIWEQGVTTLDLIDVFGHGDTASAAGRYADSIHPSDSGYVDWALALANILTA